MIISFVKESGKKKKSDIANATPNSKNKDLILISYIVCSTELMICFFQAISDL